MTLSANFQEHKSTLEDLNLWYPGQPHGWVFKCFALPSKIGEMSSYEYHGKRIERIPVHLLEVCSEITKW